MHAFFVGWCEARTALHADPAHWNMVPSPFAAEGPPTRPPSEGRVPAVKVAPPANAVSFWGSRLYRGTLFLEMMAGSRTVTFGEMDLLARSETETAASMQGMDIDLVRGSSMRLRYGTPKALSVPSVLRVLFMPFHCSFWCEQLGRPLALFMAALWTSHSALLFSRFGVDNESTYSLWALGSSADCELCAPPVLLLLVAITYGQYASNRRPKAFRLPGGKKLTAVASTKTVSPGGETDTSSDDDDSANESSASEDDDEPGSPAAVAAAAVAAAAVVAVARNERTATKDQLNSAAVEPVDLVAVGSHEAKPPVAVAVAAATSSWPDARGAVRVTTWELLEGDEHEGLRDMPFLIGEGYGRKQMMQLQDVGRLILKLSREKALNLQYLRAAAFFSLGLALGPLTYRLSLVPSVAQLYEEAERVAMVSPSSASGGASGDSGGEIVCPRILRLIWAVGLGTMTCLQQTQAIVVANAAICFVSKLVCSWWLLFHLAIVERCESQRCLQAKYFGALTSRGKSRRFGLPHFRLHKVPNIRLWLALRSHLRRIGPANTCNLIVGRACGLTLLLTLWCTVHFLKSETEAEVADDATLHRKRYCHDQNEDIGPASAPVDAGVGADQQFDGAINIELMMWNLALGFFSLRYIQISLYLNAKYKQNVALLLSEQMHCHIRMQCKPHKRSELNTTLQILKVGSKLLRELEGPHKISGLPMSPFYNSLFKLIVLSAISAVASQYLGLNLRLYKIGAGL